MFCEKCGKEIPDGSVFCEFCGAAVGTAVAAVVPAAVVPAPEAVESMKSEDEIKAALTGKKKSSKEIDSEEDIDYLVKKTAALRIFDDEAGVMNRSVVDAGGDVIVVSQFTLMASTRKGNRPSYIAAAGHETAIPLYEEFCRRMSEAVGRSVGTGEFGADMKVSLINDGPVTICIDSKNR